MRAFAFAWMEQRDIQNERKDQANEGKARQNEEGDVPSLVQEGITHLQKSIDELI